MIDKIQELMNHTKKDGSMNWIDGEDIKISLAGTFAADRFIVIANESKKPWVPAAPHPRYAVSYTHLTLPTKRIV